MAEPEQDDVGDPETVGAEGVGADLMPEASLLERLKERKLFQWAVAYLAGGWVLFENFAAVVSSSPNCS